MLKTKILETGLKIWRTDPNGVTARNIARRLKISHSGVLYHFKGNLKDSIAEYAVIKRDVKVIAQLIVLSHPAIQHMSKDEKLHYMSKV